MCLIKSMTGVAMLIVFIGRTAYATNYCNVVDNAAHIAHFKSAWTEFIKLRNHNDEAVVVGVTNNDIPGDHEPFENEYVRNAYDNCCQNLKAVYETTFNNLHTTITTLRALYQQGGISDKLVERLASLRYVLGEALVNASHWTTLQGRLGDDEEINGHIETYETEQDNIRRNRYIFEQMENSLNRDMESISNCTPHPNKRTMGLLSGVDQPKMEARNAPLPAESAAGRWEYVARENRAFHQPQGPDRLDRGSVDPLADIVRQIKVYDELQEIREAFKRRDDELFVYPMENDDRRDVRAYGQQEKPGLVAKRTDDFLTNSLAGGDASDTYYEEAKRDAETLGPFAESGKKSVRLDPLVRAQDFKRALQYLKKYLKK